MTTSITSTLPTQTLTTTEIPAEIKTTSKSSPEATLLSIADALMGLTTSTMQKPRGQGRMYARIERLVDSLSRLVDAFATFRGATEQQPAVSGAAVSGASAANAISAQPQGVQDTTSALTPTTSQSADPTAATPTIDMTPSVDTDPPAVAVTEPSAEVVTPRPAPFDLGSLLPKGGGFLWKPISDKNGDLVVLLPKKLTGKVQEVRVLSADGKKTLGKGKYSGIGNGDREHFRFSKPGSAYPDRSIVYIKLEDGTTRHLRINDTNRRIER
jgi:hypothetical protein